MVKEESIERCVATAVSLKYLRLALTLLKIPI